ncbi:homeobox-leucine zipper protein PROTODERMAL FACTOR 2-like [Coffea eugenioides]|uniref:homeobox-leucine zipper protein PROTODERMAL FACTOR 2-like n=1 Tax=Coffea eugenioides TaxID=49369 RepID=UPI000F60D24E|nr:homeobox-leucine zipper protein PROTODERMAL FACTOR 2-like [Coffea eugenioides]
MAKYAGKKFVNNNVGSSSVGPSSSANPEAMIASREWQQNVTKETVVEEELIRLLSGQTIIDKTTTTMLVNLATEELIRMAEIEYPLWIPIIDDKSYLLNQGAYYDMFTGGVWQKIAGFNVEASKGTDMVKINHVNQAKIFMDTDKWLAVFANIVSRVLVVEVISEGSESGSYNGTLLMMIAEYQALTPTIPTRESLFLRCCKQLGEGTRGIVDVSFNNSLSPGPLGKCQRRPSGCIIQGLPNNCSKVIWIEHVQVQAESIQYLGKPFVESGFAFGAPRWISTLTRQSEHLATAMQMNFSPYNDSVVISPKGRKNILKLSEKMMLDFYGGVTSSTAYA